MVDEVEHEKHEQPTITLLSRKTRNHSQNHRQQMRRAPKGSPHLFVYRYFLFVLLGI